MRDGAGIRRGEVTDAAAIAGMLRILADELGDGDVFSTTEEIVRRHGFGPEPKFTTLIAEADGTPVGLALYFRQFSTTHGQVGAYVQDLWVAPNWRGSGLGARLLSAAAKETAEAWGAEHLKLTVYHNNPDAARFYERLGFKAMENQQPMLLAGAAFCAQWESDA